MKSGLEYFPLNVNLDDKFALIEAQFGLKGFGVVVKLYQKIYGECGYYLEWTEDISLLFSQRIGLDCSLVSDIVSASIKRGIFDADLFAKYGVLTSRGIQERYLEATSRRQQVEIKKQYLLLSDVHKYKNVYISSENVNISAENADISEQSKVKKSKVKKSNNIAQTGKRFSPPSLDEVREYIRSRGSNIDPEAFHAFYEANGWVQGRDGKPIKSWKHAVITWEKMEGKYGRPKKAEPVIRGGSDYELAYK